VIDSYFEGVDLILERVEHVEPTWEFVDVDGGEVDDDDEVFWGRRVGWRLTTPYVVEVPVDKVLFMEGNQWNLGHAAALYALMEGGDRPVLDVPAARLYRIDEDDIARTQRDYDEVELEYEYGMERPWEPKDAGTFYVQLLDGNHRAAAAMAAGERTIVVTVGPNYREDVLPEEWISD